MLAPKSPLLAPLLQAFLTHPADWRYGYDISRDTHIRHGTLYPLLNRLEAGGLLESRWAAAHSGGTMQRHLYRLTEGGYQEAVALLGPSVGESGVVSRPAPLVP